MDRYIFPCRWIFLGSFTCCLFVRTCEARSSTSPNVSRSLMFYDNFQIVCPIFFWSSMPLHLSVGEISIISSLTHHYGGLSYKSGCFLLCVPVYISVCIPVCLCLCLFVCLSLCLSVFPFLNSYVCLCFCMSICHCVCVSVC